MAALVAFIDSGLGLLEPLGDQERGMNRPSVFTQRVHTRVYRWLALISFALSIPAFAFALSAFLRGDAYYLSDTTSTALIGAILLGAAVCAFHAARSAGDRRSMNERRERRKKGSSITSLTAFSVPAIALIYVLSYAPAVRISGVTTEKIVYSARDGTGASIPFESFDGEELAVYRPVDWLIDETRLRDPLFRWAGIWGVREEFEWAAIVREICKSS